jgi:hypothetical protein
MGAAGALAIRARTIRAINPKIRRSLRNPRLDGEEFPSRPGMINVRKQRGKLPWQSFE